MKDMGKRGNHLLLAYFKTLKTEFSDESFQKLEKDLRVVLIVGEVVQKDDSSGKSYKKQQNLGQIIAHPKHEKLRLFSHKIAIQLKILHSHYSCQIQFDKID